jgi:ABC-type lipoprotein export system ATPase subunit
VSTAAERAGAGGAGARPRGAAIRCENLVRIFKTDEVEVVALQGLDLEIEAGEVMAIIGSSGSGKSTLLNILGGLDRPSAGSVEVGGADLLKLSAQDLVRYRRETVGFVWQNSARNLVPYLTATENVEVPMLLARRRRGRRQRALELLRQVGVDHRAGNRLTELSGGEQQRVAIAVALANEPPLLLADEPTGNVDSQTARHLLATFREVNRELGVTVVIVTHDRAVAQSVGRVVAIRDGRTSYLERVHQAARCGGRRRRSRRRAPGPAHGGSRQRVHPAARRGGRYRRRSRCRATGPAHGGGRFVAPGVRRHRPGGAAADPARSPAGAVHLRARPRARGSGG